MPQQQQRLTAQPNQQACSPSLPISNNSTLSISSGQQRNNGNGRNVGNGRNHQYLQNHAYMTATATPGNISNNGQQTMFSNIFPHAQQMQTLPPPPPTPHNLLYNNPQASHHLRSLSSSSVHDFFTHTPPDRFLARAHLIEAKEAPAALLNNSKWDKLSQDIWNKFICSQQTEETFKQKMRLWRYLYLFIKVSYLFSCSFGYASWLIANVIALLYRKIKYFNNECAQLAQKINYLKLTDDPWIGDNRLIFSLEASMSNMVKIRSHIVIAIVIFVPHTRNKNSITAIFAMLNTLDKFCRDWFRFRYAPHIHIYPI